MQLLDLPIFGALKSRMQYHSARQVVLAENVANAETPDYTARDVRRPDFARMVQDGPMQGPLQVSMPARTNELHLAGFEPLSGRVKREDTSFFEVTPEGNSVVLEEEMMKITQNQMDHQMAATLYSRGMSILKTAMGRQA